MKWNSSLYDSKHDFVSAYGMGLIDYIPEEKGLKVFDLGCGTGVLAAKLRDLGLAVTGVDGSADMIGRAKESYPDMDFSVCDALDLPFDHEFDVVFSNAVFHWIADHGLLCENLAKVLKPEGMLVCEFGAYGNILGMETALSESVKKYGVEYHSLFNFPKEGVFEGLLEQNGFEILVSTAFDRPTPLKEGEKGMRNWIWQFCPVIMNGLTEEIRETVISETEKRLYPTHWNGECWIADYRRLRVVARKRVE